MSRRFFSTLLALLSVIFLNAQEKGEQRDSLVQLLSSQSAQVVEINGESYRKVIGPARFLHNNTYMDCDTAFWNVDTRIIIAVGNVSILQQETVLTSDRLTYLIDDDLAQFRGSLVQLQDKDHNTLRTHNLDYNTKDSLATFFGGASMRDKDGQIIESNTGHYSSPLKKFTFTNDVNMFTDSIFVKTNTLEYESEKNLATFGTATHMWKEDNMLSSEAGWYDRNVETFFFTDRVHVQSRNQEGWCDSLFFFRLSNNVRLLNNAQVNDTTRNVYALAGQIDYVDSLSRVTLVRKPAVVSMVTEKIMQPDSTYKEEPDTVYMGAEYLSYYTRQKYKIDSTFAAAAVERKNVLDFDPVSEFRRKAAEEAARAAEEAAKNDPNYHPDNVPDVPEEEPEPVQENKDSLDVAADSLGTAQDSLAMSSADSLAMAGTDSLSTAGADSLAVADSVKAEPLDTTAIGFLDALHNVKIYRRSMQVICDSLVYSDLDSLARLFKSPVIYQEGTRQYSADSISVVVRNETMDKASLMSNAFIALEEDTLHHNQIKSTEMMAYFDGEGGLRRFDALGGAQALFYIEENDTLATVNKKDSKMLSALFKEGDIDRIFYFESPKSDAYPLAQMTREERELKGFLWQPEKCPADRYAVTDWELRPGERSRYDRVPRGEYKHTERYFPGYMGDVYRQIQVRDSLKVVRDRERALAEQEAERTARLDSLALADSLATADSLHLADSLAKAAERLAVADSLAKVDSLKTAVPADEADSLYRSMSPKERKAYDKEQARLKKEARKKKKQEMREAKWKKLDEKDEAKRKAREAKRLEKERALKRKALREIAEQERRDRQVYENYLKKYRKQAERDRLKAERQAGKKVRKSDKTVSPEKKVEKPEKGKSS